MSNNLQTILAPIVLRASASLSAGLAGYESVGADNAQAIAAGAMAAMFVLADLTLSWFRRKKEAKK